MLQGPTRVLFPPVFVPLLRVILRCGQRGLFFLPQHSFICCFARLSYLDRGTDGGNLLHGFTSHLSASFWLCKLHVANLLHMLMHLYCVCVTHYD